MEFLLKLNSDKEIKDRQMEKFILLGVFPDFPVMRHQSDPDFKDHEISLYVQVHRPKVNKMISYQYMHLLNINFTI